MTTLTIKGRVTEMSNDNLAEIPLFVGLTTLPSRIGLLRPMLDSLINQTKKPDRILLSLPGWSSRENCRYDVPDWLSSYSSLLQVIECGDDYGPGTKLLGCLDHLPDSACLILADDDMVYKPYFLDGLYTNTINNPGISFSYYTFPAGPFVVGQGADGFSFLVKDLEGIKGFAARVLINPHLRVEDDLWISAFLLKAGVIIRSLQHTIPGGGTVYTVVHDLNQLRHIVGDLEREKSIAEGIRYLLESGMMGKRRQLAALAKNAVLTLLGRT